MHIRVATPDDAEELLGIYAPYVEQTAVTFECDAPTVQEFRSRIEHTLEAYPYLVMVSDERDANASADAAAEPGRILGYAYAGPLKTRAAYIHSAEASVYVHSDIHGRGIGRALYQSLEAALGRMGVLNLYAATTDDPRDPYLTNASIRFHEHVGFHVIGTLSECGYKFGRWYGDTIVEEAPGHAHPVRSSFQAIRRVGLLTVRDFSPR